MNWGSVGDVGSGGVYSALTQKVYGIPCFSSDVLVFNPLTNISALVSVLGSNTPGVCRWHAGVVGLDGKIYGIPEGAASILIFDPRTNASDTTSLGGLGSAIEKWSCNVISSSGRIFGAPRDADSLLVIDPDGGKTSTAVAGFGAMQEKWGSCQIVRDTLYCIPRNADSVLIVRRECALLGEPL